MENESSHKLNRKMLNKIEGIITQKDNENILLLDAATGAGECTISNSSIHIPVIVIWRKARDYDYSKELAS